MATQYAFGKIVTDGLVLALDAADRNSYVSGSTTWFDLSGNNNSGSLINVPTFTSLNGGRISFDGVNEYFLNSNNLLADNLPNMTVSCWIYADWASLSSIAWCPIITKISDASNGSGWEFGANSQFSTRPNIYFFNQGSGGSAYKVSATLIASSSYWMNIVASYSGSVNNQASLYINGVNQITTNTVLSTIVTTTTTASVAIATRNGVNSFGTKYSPINVSNTIIYNRSLTAQEILQNYNAQKSRFNL